MFIYLPSAEARVINVPHDYASISEAIGVAKAGDTVMVSGGEYVENLRIEVEINLIADSGAEAAIIKAKDTSTSVVEFNSVKGVNISGFTLIGSDKAGLLLKDVTNSRVTRNSFHGNYYGLLLEDSHANLISDNESSENVDGLTLSSSDFNDVRTNIIESNSEKGVVLLNARENLITENTINSNYWNGITIWSSFKNTITSNTIIKNTYAIVESDSGENEISSNRMMRRLYYLLPVALIYFGILFYFIEKRLFYYYFRKRGKKYSPVETR
jgi:parallel beta-helix repeat protein